jgi:hypothetical protein
LASSTLDPRSHGLSADIAHLFYFVGAGCEDEGMREQDLEDIGAVSSEVAAARREAAMALARLAEISMKYADVRTASDREDAAIPKPGRAKPGEFVADELSLMLREQPYAVRCLIARSRRLSAAMPTVWQAYRDGDLDAEQVGVIDRVARRVCEPLTLAAIDEQSVEAAQSRCPKQLAAWLLRLVVRLEPLAFEQRHRRALAERRVTVIQGVDGMGYVTGEVSAADAAAIDGMLAAAARSLSAQDPRTEQQRRSDLFADLLLGRLRFAETDADEDQTSHAATSEDAADGHLQRGSTDGDVQRSSTDRNVQPSSTDGEVQRSWLEVEDIDPDTGELLGTHLQPIDTNGEPVGEPIDPALASATRFPPHRRQTTTTTSDRCDRAADQPAGNQRRARRTHRSIGPDPQLGPT